MNAIWVSLKGNIKCSSKITDVAQKATMRKRRSSLDDEVTDNDSTRNRFHELGRGEASRNVIEMIYRSSSSAKPKKIKRVLKVNNPADVVAKFENYRKEAMISSNQQHPRNVVDGNEVLQFYGTTMSCCSGSGSGSGRVRISRLCSLAGCRVCRVIGSGFDTYYNKIHGIRLSTKSNAMTEEAAAAATANKAVIICRTIAAGVEYSVGDTILVPNPTALLPCFVLLFH